MANTLLTISMITYEAMIVLENELKFTKYVRRDLDDYYGKVGAKIGDTLNVRVPPRFVGRLGQAIQIEDVTETSVPVTLAYQRGVDIAFSSADRELSVDNYRERYLKPMIAKLANFIDNDGMQQYVNVYNEIGTPGTVPNALLTYLQAGQRLDEEAAPRDSDRSLVINPGMQATIVDALKGLFQDSTSIAEQYEKGTMGKTIGFKWSMDQNVQTQVVGPLGGTPVVNGAGQTGATLITNGWTAAAASRLNVGDVFTIGSGTTGVYAVNPQSLQSTGALRQFVVTAPVSSDGSGNATIPIYPSITPNGAFATVSNTPATGASINVLGAAGTSTPQGLAFHKDAFVLACADMPLYKGVHEAARVRDEQLGLSIRVIQDYDINLDRCPCRLDILYGWATLYPQLACRVAS